MFCIGEQLNIPKLKQSDNGVLVDDGFEYFFGGGLKAVSTVISTVYGGCQIC